MCGILGVYNKDGLNQVDLDNFTYMFKESSRRGEDASGVGLQDMSYIKAPMSSGELIQKDE